MSAPAVSVILPTYNRASLLPRAIASVLGQSFADFELIVVDDGSTDRTVDVVRQFDDPRIIYLPPEKNLGDAGARNRGIAKARGEWLGFQDSDDEWLPDKLKLQIAVAKTLTPDYAAVASGLMRFVGGPVERIVWPTRGPVGQASTDVDRDAFVGGFTAFLQSLLLRHTAVTEVGGFDTRLRARSDFDLCLRLIHRYRFAAIDRPTVLSYETLDSLSQRLDYRIADMRHLLAEHEPLLSADRRAFAGFLYELAKAEIMAGELKSGRARAAQALRLHPQQLRCWALITLSALGSTVVREAARASLERKYRLHAP